MAEEYLAGKDVLLYKWDTIDMEWEPIACAVSNSFSTTLNFLESITKCDESTRRRPTSKTYASSADLIIVTKATQETDKVYYNALQDAADNMTKAWYAFRSSEITNKTVEKYFEAYIESIEITAERESNTEVSVSFGIDGDAVNIDPFATT
ncbi:Phage major tail protein 2 [compost metagenome]